MGGWLAVCTQHLPLRTLQILHSRTNTLNMTFVWTQGLITRPIFNAKCGLISMTTSVFHSFFCHCRIALGFCLFDSWLYSWLIVYYIPYLLIGVTWPSLPQYSCQLCIFAASITFLATALSHFNTFQPHLFRKITSYSLAIDRSKLKQLKCSIPVTEAH